MGGQTDFCRRLHTGTFSPWPAHQFDRDFRQFLNHDRIQSAVGPAEGRRGADMNCPICRDLAQAFEAGHSEYIEACGQEECRYGTRQVRVGRAPACMRVRRRGACTLAGTEAVNEFETTGGIASAGSPPEWTFSPPRQRRGCSAFQLTYTAIAVFERPMAQPVMD